VGTSWLISFINTTKPLISSVHETRTMVAIFSSKRHVQVIDPRVVVYREKQFQM